MPPGLSNGEIPKMRDARDSFRPPMTRSARVPILTWHAMGVSGNDYATNDHVAFARDLEAIHAAGLRIVSLRRIADALIAGRLDKLEGCVGLSIDDGADLDFHDVPQPAWGPQRGMLRVLADFRARRGVDAQPDLHLTSFAVVSPQARAHLDRTCMAGCGWWNDDWWPAAEATGLMSIENHSWDHNHESLETSATTAAPGTFAITSETEAEVEIGAAARWLRQRRQRGGAVLFAYPYDDVSEFLSTSWLPRHGPAGEILAAYAGDSAPVVRESSRWRIPRYGFGRDWKSESGLLDVLRDAGVAARPRGRIFRMLAAAKGRLRAAGVRRARTWSDHLRTWEVSDARVLAGDLFRRSFGQDVPDYPRHFVLVYSPESGPGSTTPEVVAYCHQRAFEEVYLEGGMCADAGAYRRMPRWLFEQARAQGGLATIVSRQSIAMLGDSPATFGHVGEPRARAADLRTGFVDTGKEHLMVFWRRELPEEEKRRLIERVASIGAF